MAGGRLEGPGFGWVLLDEPVARVEAVVDGRVAALARLGTARPDVEAAHPERPDALLSGFHLDVVPAPGPPRRVVVRAVGVGGATHVVGEDALEAGTTLAGTGPPRLVAPVPAADAERPWPAVVAGAADLVLLRAFERAAAARADLGLVVWGGVHDVVVGGLRRIVAGTWLEGRVRFAEQAAPWEERADVVVRHPGGDVLALQRLLTHIAGVGRDVEGA
ncbi:MAG: hypothetical protein HZB46_16585 [Solirubrobacterales bacterium]|nr:hypothetical protein [Solirubrobacterales bacterium]